MLKVSARSPRLQPALGGRGSILHGRVHFALPVERKGAAMLVDAGLE